MFLGPTDYTPRCPPTDLLHNIKLRDFVMIVTEKISTAFTTQASGLFIIVMLYCLALV